MAIDVYQSSRFESLWMLFCQHLEAPLGRVLAEQLIVVPAGGWESYFSRALARRQGCWAHYRFRTLGQWVNRQLTQTLGAQSGGVRDAEALTWAIASRLPALCDDADFVPVKDYLQAEDQADVRRRIELARRIAGLFDQYLVYRPDLIDSWRDADSLPDDPMQHAPWQRKLFHSLDAQTPLRTIDERITRFAETLQSGTVTLPERVQVWMCGSVPPVYLRFLDVVGAHIPIQLYIVSPTFAGWGDRTQQRKLLGRMQHQDTPLRKFCEAQQLDMPHPLLESWGKLSLERQLLMLPYDSDRWRYHDVPASAEPDKRGTLLESLQHDLRAGGDPDPRPLVADTSMRVHSCHSAIREVEVLQDQLRDAFEADPGLQPEQVVVLCPDLDTYGPLIDAVFGRIDPGQGGHIPYTVAGRSPRQTRGIIDAYFRILDVLQGRFAASEVVDLLHLAPVQAAAGMDDDQVQTITGWIADSGVRWGVDAAHRVAEELPASDLNTWQFGLDRLLMGYAMPPGGGQLVGGVLALDRGSGLAGQSLGCLAAFIDQLQSWREQIRQVRPMSQWQELLGQIADQFLDQRQDEIGVQRIHDTMGLLRQVAEQHGFDEAVPFSVAANELARMVDQSTGGRAFQLGGITFCEMAAMRSLPFQVVALLGWNDGVFPRVDRPIGFDLIARHPRFGDRSLRLEDKHLALEALLAARCRLLITYQGQNVRDHRLRPPSIVVEELLDVIEQTCSGDQTVRSTRRAEIVTRHPLQPFSPRYFDQSHPGLFSYDRGYLQAAQGLLAPPEDIPPFFVAPLAEDANVVEIRVRDLRKLMDAPWELFLARLGVRLAEAAEVGSDREPLFLNHLEQWQVGEQWIQRRLSEMERDQLIGRLRRGGQLPAGRLGEKLLQRIVGEAEPVVDAAERIGVDSAAPSLPVHVKIDDLVVVGRIEGVSSAGLRRATYSKMKISRTLRLWLDHLLVAASLQQAAGDTRIVGRLGKCTTIGFKPIAPDAALEHLTHLLQWYLAAVRVPLPLFPAPVDRAIEQLHQGKFAGNDDRLDDGFLHEAEDAFQRSFLRIPDAEKASVRIAFAGREPFRMTCQEVPGLEKHDQEVPEQEKLGDKNLFLYLVNSICRPMLPYIVHQEQGPARGRDV